MFSIPSNNVETLGQVKSMKLTGIMTAATIVLSSTIFLAGPGFGNSGQAQAQQVNSGCKTFGCRFKAWQKKIRNRQLVAKIARQNRSARIQPLRLPNPRAEISTLSVSNSGQASVNVSVGCDAATSGAAVCQEQDVQAVGQVSGVAASAAPAAAAKSGSHVSISGSISIAGAVSLSDGSTVGVSDNVGVSGNSSADTGAGASTGVGSGVGSAGAGTSGTGNSSGSGSGSGDSASGSSSSSSSASAGGGSGNGSGVGTGAGVGTSSGSN